MSRQTFTFIHVSDLHFDRIEDQVVNSLLSFIQERKDLRLIIITGDLTQRAKVQQFKDAMKFIEALPCPVFVVPGNHDVPLYNVFLRFFWPYKKFIRFLGKLSVRTYEDRDLQVFGLWTLNRFSVKDGKINKKEIEAARQFFKNDGRCQIIAAHHPLEHLRSFQNILDLKADLILSGHEHQSGIVKCENTLLISSGTSTSTRLRKEKNSFNLITVTPHEVKLKVFTYSEESQTFKSLEDLASSDSPPASYQERTE